MIRVTEKKKKQEEKEKTKKQTVNILVVVVVVVVDVAIPKKEIKSVSGFSQVTLRKHTGNT